MCSTGSCAASHGRWMHADTSPVYILDLDGTILSTNSFPHWVLYLMRAPFPRIGAARRLSISGFATAMLVQRKLRLTGHERFKWRLQKLWRTATDGDDGAGARAFVEQMIGYIRPELSTVLSAVAGGRIDAVMATAAPADYAYPLGCAVGFSHVLATSSARAVDELSNVGDRKCTAVLRFLASRGWQHRRRVLFTDHEDDLPLIGVCDDVFWFGSERGRQAISYALPDISIRSGFAGSAIPTDARD
jgi:phosphoserine phosphatase